MVKKQSKIYHIKINNWAKHNGSKKKNHRYFLLENRFFNDEKIVQLSALETRLYLYLLTVASDLNQDSYTLHTNSIPSYFKLRTDSIQTSLNHFESLQLVTLQKNSSFVIQNNTKQENIIENNCIPEKKIRTVKKSNPKNEIVLPDDKSSGPSKSYLFISKYCDLFKQRYFTNAEISKKESGIAKRIAEDLSEEKINLYLEAYFRMPDAWLTKIKHPLHAFESKKNEIIVFANSGKFTTQKQASEFDKTATSYSTLQQIREGKL